MLLSDGAPQGGNAKATPVLAYTGDKNGAKVWVADAWGNAESRRNGGEGSWLNSLVSKQRGIFCAKTRNFALKMLNFAGPRGCAAGCDRYAILLALATMNFARKNDGGFCTEK